VLNFSIVSLCIMQLCEYVFPIGLPLYVSKNGVFGGFEGEGVKILSGNFGYMGGSNPWDDLDQMRLVGRYRGRNHVCNISVKGCGCGERGKFAFSH